VELFEATGNPLWLSRALDLTRVQLSLFWDGEKGGFFDTSGRDASILVRSREQYDGAEPAGNSIAAMNLLRLGALTGNAGFLERAESTLNAFGPWLEKQPSIMPCMVSAALQMRRPPSQIVIVGRKEDAATAALWRECNQRYLPGMARIHVDPEWRDRLAELIPYAGEVVQKDGVATAYVCSNFTCQLPVTEPAELGRMLDGL
jgi:uncharacterized protein YyaL (SSP411 family)